ncbi:MAG: Eco57I restriction-modification methylase domain-containing protein [Caulobacter sp.]|nr:Eco57I restriction-modification methylase domain-containing protein [Caulobacter sp.]
MTETSPFALLKRNPDVLTCIANLSNDEVFTPPEFAARMLDTLAEGWAAANGGANLWGDSTVTFLDPCTKTGVFLREIAKRLIDGLAKEFPDLQERVDHILANQLYGVGITRLTALLARRGLYCSKWANGPHSVATGFDGVDGNIWFQRTEHSWNQGRCRYCAASREVMDRDAGLESHAYAFIHSDDIKARPAQWFGDDMQFDVIIGNPPYQMTGSGGGTNDAPIYQHFVEQAMRLEPRFLSMVIPSRWMAGGRGLGEFRAEFLRDRRLRALVDHENAKDVFPSVGIGGGVCYFLWDRDHSGQCECTFNRNGEVIGPHPRSLDEFDVFVRDARSLDILRRVVGSAEPSFETLVSGDTPFGLATNFTGFVKGATPDALQVSIHANVGGKRVQGVMASDKIVKNPHLIANWKLFLSKTGSGRERERTGVDLVLSPPIVGAPGSVCTQTYLVAAPFESEAEAVSADSYLRTKLTRFLVSLRKPSQDVLRGAYRWVPIQSWDRTWTDAELYKKYRISPEEQAFIESKIRPMEGGV